MRTGIFAGSFDPFTIGHQSVVRRALPLFDKIIIGVGTNTSKRCMHTPDERVEAIRRIYEGEERVEVCCYSGLTATFARERAAGYIIKGVRSAADFESERAQADINRRISGVETILLVAEPGLDSISSSVVRELASFGMDVSEYLPQLADRNKNDGDTQNIEHQNG